MILDSAGRALRRPLGFLAREHVVETATTSVVSSTAVLRPTNTARWNGMGGLHWQEPHMDSTPRRKKA